MAQFEKWIEGVTGADAVCELAQHSLRARLAAVEYFLPLAAERAGEGVEFVHELRGGRQRRCESELPARPECHLLALNSRR